MHPHGPEIPNPTRDSEDAATAEADVPPQGRPSLPLRAILVMVGTVSLVIGVLGIVVPVLPTTPFLLLAAACYARASDRLYGWLIGQRSLGPIITEWRTSRSLPPGVRARALAVVVLSFGVSIVLVDGILLRGALGVTGLIVAIFLYRIPTRP